MEDKDVLDSEFPSFDEMGEEVHWEESVDNQLFVLWRALKIVMALLVMSVLVNGLVIWKLASDLYSG